MLLAHPSSSQKTTWHIFALSANFYQCLKKKINQSRGADTLQTQDKDLSDQTKEMLPQELKEKAIHHKQTNKRGSLMNKITTKSKTHKIYSEGWKSETVFNLPTRLLDFEEEKMILQNMM